jgi:hypothetical protein
MRGTKAVGALHGPRNLVDSPCAHFVIASPRLTSLMPAKTSVRTTSSVDRVGEDLVVDGASERALGQLQ